MPNQPLSMDAMLDQLNRCVRLYEAGLTDGDSFANVMTAAYTMTAHWREHLFDHNELVRQGMRAAHRG